MACGSEKPELFGQDDYIDQLPGVALEKELGNLGLHNFLFMQWYIAVVF